jgi:Pyruvate/2-oxoacid:ferredoxin oxidoreductase gamma subunit
MVMLGAFMRENSLLKSDSIMWAIEHISMRFASSNVKAFRKGRGFVLKEGAGQ